MAKETTKQDTKIKELKAKLAEANYRIAVLTEKVEILDNNLAVCEQDLDVSYIDTENILGMIKETADNAENNFNEFIKHTGEFTVADAVYCLQLLHRTAQHFYNPKTNQDEE